MKANLYQDLQPPLRGELFDTLLQHGRLRIERILSSAEPEPILYDQEQDEWVLLLEGRAELRIAGEIIELEAGDHVFLPAHTPHEVLATYPEPRCLWLAVHLDLE